MKSKGCNRRIKEFARKIYRILSPRVKKLSLKSSKRVKGREENSKNDFLNSKQPIELPLEAKRTWNDTYERGDDSNWSDLDKHDIYSSEN